VLLTGPFGGLTEAEAGLLQLTDLGREFLDLPEAAQLGFVFAAWWEGVDWGEWAPSPLLPSPQPLPTNPTAWPAQDHGPGRLGRCVAPCW
jgi:hypothetical protein